MRGQQPGVIGWSMETAPRRTLVEYGDSSQEDIGGARRREPGEWRWSMETAARMHEELE